MSQCNYADLQDHALILANFVEGLRLTVEKGAAEAAAMSRADARSHKRVAEQLRKLEGDLRDLDLSGYDRDGEDEEDCEL